MISEAGKVGPGMFIMGALYGIYRKFSTGVRKHWGMQVVVLLACAGMGVAQTVSPEDLQVARQAYEDGVLDLVKQRLRPLAYATDFSRKEDQEGLLLLAFAAYRQNLTATAERFLDRLLITNPLWLDDFELYLLKLNIFFTKEDFYLAEKTVDLIWNMTQSRDRRYQVLDMLVENYFKHGEYHLALGYLRDRLATLSDEGDLAKLRLSIMEVLLRKGQLEEAHQLLLEVAIAPGMPGVQEQADLLTGRLHLGEGDYNRGMRQYLKLYEEASMSESGRQESLFGLCLSYWNLGDTENARESLETYIRTYPLASNLGDAHLMLGQVYLNLEAFAMAELLLEELTAMSLEKGLYAKSLYWLGEAKYRQQKYEEAEAVYRKLIAMKELDLLNAVYGVVGLAWVCYDQNLFEQAGEYFLEALAIPMDHPFIQDAWVMAGNCFYLQERYAEAEGYYKQFLEKFRLSQRRDEVHFKLGYTRMKRGQLREAVQTWMDLAERSPGGSLTEEAYWRAGKTLYDAGLFEDAYQAFVLLTTRFPEGNFSDFGFLELGNCLYNLARYGEALEAYRITRDKTRLDEVRYQAIYFMGWCHFLMNEEREALEIFETALTSYPDTNLAPQIRFWLGEYEYNRYRFDRAVTHFELFIDQFPDHELLDNCYYLASKSAYRMGDFASAIRWLSGMIGLFPESDLIPDAVFLKGEAHLQLGDHQAAVEELIVFDTSFEESYLRPEAFERLGDAFLALGQEKNALVYLEKAHDLMRSTTAKDDPDLQLKMALCHRATGDSEKALELALNVIYDAADDAQFVQAVDLCAGIYESKGDYDNAIKVLAKLLKEAKSIDPTLVKQRIRILKYHQIHGKDAS